jgi:hypothetical protein
LFRSNAEILLIGGQGEDDRSNEDLLFLHVSLLVDMAHKILDLLKKFLYFDFHKGDPVLSILCDSHVRNTVPWEWTADAGVLKKLSLAGLGLSD